MGINAYLCSDTPETAKEIFINRYLDPMLAFLLCKHLTRDPRDWIFSPNIIRSVYSQGNGLDEIITPWRLDVYKTKKRRRDWDKQRRTYTWNRLYSFTQAWPFLSLYLGGTGSSKVSCWKTKMGDRKSCRGSLRGREWTERDCVMQKLPILLQVYWHSTLKMLLYYIILYIVGYSVFIKSNWGKTFYYISICKTIN